MRSAHRIDDHEPQSQQDVARRLDVDRTTMVALIDDFESKALASRIPAPDDRRKNVVALTARARETLTAALTATAQAENDFLSALSKADAKMFRRLLATVVGA
jgi:DNA-binding MarR family transcriptional regulator